MNTQYAITLAVLFLCATAKAQTNTADDGTSAPMTTQQAKEKEKADKLKEKEAAKAAKDARDPAEVAAEKEAKKEKKVAAKQEVKQEKAAAAAAAPPKQHKPVNFDIGLNVNGTTTNVGVHQDNSGHTQVNGGLNGTSVNVNASKQGAVVNDNYGNSVGYVSPGPAAVTPSAPVVANNAPQPVAALTCTPMANADFTAVMAAIAAQPDDSAKLYSAKQGGYGQCFTTAQIKQVCKTFKADETKLAFAEYMYGNCADRPNYGTLKGVFLYMASVQSLNNFMQAAR